MKKQDWCIHSKDRGSTQLWIQELQILNQSSGGGLFGNIYSKESGLAPVILVDARQAGWKDWVQDLDRDQKSIILVLDEKTMLPKANELKLVDDLLVYPFRLAEVLSVTKHHYARVEHQVLLKEVVETQKDLLESGEVLERILKAKTPRRYTGIKGMQIMSRHLSGLKPGGDYFDVFESDKKDFVNLLLVDSSSYGISAALLGMILSSSAKMANDSKISTSEWVRTIYEELKTTLGEKGHFSVFFGRINRRDFSLHYQLHGSIESFVIHQDGTPLRLEKQGSSISESAAPSVAEEKVLSLHPKDRIVLLSDGFVNGVGGEIKLEKVFQEKLEKEPFDLVNELSFQIKSKLNPGETFPGEDCSAIVIDIESRVLRLAPTG